MQLDLHYYGVAFLARAAGFSQDEAEIIAYSSQYVDDSTEGSPVHVGDYLFNPVRTAHYSLKAFTWGVQSKIFIPFHFLPPKIRQCNLVTGEYPTSPMAKMIFNRACAESDTKLRLVRIGVALHTIADTYSHQGFSGRDHEENRLASCSALNTENVSNFTICKRIKSMGAWICRKAKKIIRPAVPAVGHVHAIHNPDIPHLEWDYIYSGKELPVHRDNKEVFLMACKQIYTLLCDAVQPKKRANAVKEPDRIKPLKSWEEIKSSIIECLASSAYDSDNNDLIEDDELFRCECWLKIYAKCFDEELTLYDKYYWRMEALKPANPKHVRWDTMSKEEISRHNYNHNPKFFSSYWVRFHRAAMTQRYLVLYHLQ